MTYPGGKNGSGVYQRIINLMPPHRVYIEPFAGGAAILRAKRPARINIALDLDVTPIMELDRVRADIAANGVVGRSGDTWEFRVGDAIEFLRETEFRGDELVYCDPPYLHETRASASIYRHEMTDAQHDELLAIIKNLPCMVMISAYWSEVYADALADWNAIVYPATTRGGTAEEWLWFNFEPPQVLHDYRYLGETYRERERIRRKTRRTLARLERLPDLERQALLTAIAERWPCSHTGSGDGTRSNSVENDGARRQIPPDRAVRDSSGG